MQWTRTRVLPEPAPASTSNGPSGCSTAARCSGFNAPRMATSYRAGVTTQKGRSPPGERPLFAFRDSTGLERQPRAELDRERPVARVGVAEVRVADDGRRRLLA